jgi:ABC-type transporter Mla subunit MlaD
MALQDLTPQLRTRLSRLERAVGWFVILAVGLLAFGFVYYVYHTAERKGWFLTKAPYYTFVDRATGLKEGDPVKLMGFDVGQITRITSQPPEDVHNVYVEFEIKSPYYGYLWTEGSRTRVAQADFLGKRSLEVTKGTNGYPTYVFSPLREMSVAEAANLADSGNWKLAAEIYDAHGTNLLFRALTPLSKPLLATLAESGISRIGLLDARQERKAITAVWNDQRGAYEPYGRTNLYWLVADESPAVTERIEQVVDAVQAALPGVLNLTNQLARVLSNSAALASKLDAVVATAHPAVSNLAAATAHLDHPGGLGEWLLPTNISRQLEGALGSTSATLAAANTNLTALALHLERSLDNLAMITSNLNAQVAANTNMLSAISDMVVHADQFVQGLKQHWLLRSAFKSRDTNAPPAAAPQRLKSPKD